MTPSSSAGLAVHDFPAAGGGGAAPLLVLPGLLGDGRKLQRLGRDLARDRPVLLVDPLGGGGSEAPADPAAYAWDEQVRRLFQLLDERGLRGVDVLGLSLGGMWAQQALCRDDGRLRRVVLAATCLLAGPRLVAIVEALRAQVRCGVPPLCLARSLMVLLFSPAFLDRPGAVPLLEGMLTAEQGPREGLLGQLAAIQAHDLSGTAGPSGRAGPSGPPGLAGDPRVVRLLGGARDLLTPPGDLQRLAAALPAAPLHLLPDAGHCLWIEQPDAFADRVLAALPLP